MLKLLGKLLVIILVIGLFTAGVYYLVQGTSLGSASGFGERGFEPRLVDPNAANGAAPGQFQGHRRPEGFGEGGGERGEGGFSLFRGLAGVLGHALQIALVTVLVLFIRRLLSERKTGPAVTQG